MGIGGLLGSALLGGVAGASQGVYEEATNSLKDKRERALEMMRHGLKMDEAKFQQQGAIAVEHVRNTNENERLKGEREWKGKENTLDRQAQLTAAGIAASGRAPAYEWDDSTVIDPLTGERTTRLFNKRTGEWADDGSSDQNLAMLMPEAEKYADKKISEMAGYLSTDASDFAKFGGDREQAKSFFMQEYLNMATGKGAPGPVGLLQQKFGQR